MNPAILRNIKIAAMPTNAIIYGDHEVDSSTSIDDRVASIFNLFVKHGDMNYVGEDVSQLQHAQQVKKEIWKFRVVLYENMFIGQPSKSNTYTFRRPNRLGTEITRCM